MRKAFILLLAILIFGIVKAQNVGIGTFSPQANLEIKNASRAKLKISSNNYSDSTTIIFSNRIGFTGTDFLISSNREEGLRISSESDLGNNTNSNILHITPQGAVGIGGNPNASSILDINSTNKGLLVPRMTGTNLGNISNPATGLFVYQTDGNSGFYYNRGTPATPNWISVTTSASGWNLTGNTGTDTSVNFIGTTDNKDLKFRVNNTRAGTIGTNQSSFIGLGSGTLNTGTGNTGMGANSLATNTSGTNNTSIGYKADVGSAGLTNATAIGANASVGSSNALILGSISGVNGAVANTQVGIGTVAPNTSAVLDIQSTSKGILIPRMQLSQRPASPATGLMIYQTDNDPGFYYNVGTPGSPTWKKTDEYSGSNGTQLFISPTTSFIVPAGIYRILFEAGSGGGGSGGNYGSTNPIYCGGGGGGGAFLSGYLTVTPGQTLTVNVGAAGQFGSDGSGATPATSGTAGGNTTVFLGATNLFTLGGGQPGIAGSSGIVGTGGTGGSVISSDATLCKRFINLGGWPGLQGNTSTNVLFNMAGLGGMMQSYGIANSPQYFSPTLPLGGGAYTLSYLTAPSYGKGAGNGSNSSYGYVYFYW